MGKMPAVEEAFQGPGEVLRYSSFPSAYSAARDVLVWLPDGYHDSHHHYAVIYMQDGQNVFSSLSGSNDTWNVDKHLTQLAGVRKAIVVAPYHGSSMRFSEYAPGSVIEELNAEDRQRLLDSGAPPKGDGRVYYEGKVCSDGYIKFLADELKPMIDKTYRTKADKSNTFLLGSSMGGMISMYGLISRPDVFGGAACLSAHWPLSITDDFLEESWSETLKPVYHKFLSKLPEPGTFLLWVDRGNLELDQYYEPYDSLLGALQARGLQPKDYVFRSYPGTTHNEACWSARLPEVLQFLLKENGTKASKGGK